jgi:hypothetical protein
MTGQGRGRGKPAVFVGPSLPVSEAEQILEADYLPPAAQGSFIEAVQQLGPTAILLIDGVFQGEPAVRHKEILWTMAQGIPVFGAASMGALRAAELWPYGMVGVGLIFRWYRRYQCAPDDAVAVLHGPPEIGSPPLTQSLIDLRIALRLAEGRAIIDRALRLELVRIASRLNFRERTVAQIVELAHRSCPAFEQGRKAIEEALSNLYISQKKIDALQALQMVDRAVSTGKLKAPVTPEFKMTAAFRRDLEDASISLE